MGHSTLAVAWLGNYKQKTRFVIAAMLIGGALAGCGSSSPPHQSGRKAQRAAASATQHESTSSTTSTSNTADTISPAEPNTDHRPSFISGLSTEQGDEVSVKGWFGPALPVSASNVDQAALSGCIEPAQDDRAMVVELDLITTITSSLSGKVELFAADVNGYGYPGVDFVMGFSGGASCEATTDGAGTGINLGTLQPHQPHDFTMWVVMPNAITPEHLHPTERQLGEEEHWVMAPLHISLNGSTPVLQGGEGLEGPRVVSCSIPNGMAEAYVAVVGYTPKSISPGSCPSITSES